MGIDIFSAQFLCSEARKGIRFARMLTLGRQSVYMEQTEYSHLLASLGGTLTTAHYADDLFSALGAASIDIMDASDYEGANRIQDLNHPVEPGLLASYDLVFDGGALEHVFNFPTALKNCLEMTKVGGHFITITPTSNYSGHGFYQFSPELFYTALSAQNGFTIERMLFVYRNRWYAVRDPNVLRRRVELITDERTLLFVSSRRCQLKPIFQSWPQQSDYVQAWTETSSSATLGPSAPSWKRMLANVLPFRERLFASRQQRKLRRECSPLSADLFEPVDLD